VKSLPKFVDYIDT